MYPPTNIWEGANLGWNMNNNNTLTESAIFFGMSDFSGPLTQDWTTVSFKANVTRFKLQPTQVEWFQLSTTQNVPMTMIMMPVVSVGNSTPIVTNPDYSSYNVYPNTGNPVTATSWDTWFAPGPGLTAVYQFITSSPTTTTHPTTVAAHTSTSAHTSGSSSPTSVSISSPVPTTTGS